MTNQTERRDFIRDCVAAYYDGHYQAFVDDLNDYFGEKMLCPTTLSRQLSGRTRVSNAWYVAYKLFFLKEANNYPVRMVEKLESI